jgi:putative transposase
VIPFQWFTAALCRWVQRQRDDVIAFLRLENRVLKAQLRGRPLRLTNPERRRLAALGHRLGRRTLGDIATIVSPDTILRWHRELDIRQSTYAGRRGGRPRLQAHIRLLIVRMATENASWGYTRLQGTLKNLGHQVGRFTIARILKEHGIPPSRHRPMAWRTFVRAHWPALLDFFRTEVSRIRGLVSYCAALMMGLRFRRVYLVGWTPCPNEHFLLDRVRQFTTDIDGVFRPGCSVICDRDTNRRGAVHRLLASTKVRGIQGRTQSVCGTVRALEERGPAGPNRTARTIIRNGHPLHSSRTITANAIM